MVSLVKKLARGWAYDVVSVGFPGPVLHNRPVAEPETARTLRSTGAAKRQNHRPQESSKREFEDCNVDHSQRCSILRVLSAPRQIRFTSESAQAAQKNLDALAIRIRVIALPSSALR
jgi:hypothetical protein